MNVYIGFHGQEWLPQATVYLRICFLKLAFAVWCFQWLEFNFWSAFILKLWWKHHPPFFVVNV